jgi:hypothetical protein
MIDPVSLEVVDDLGLHFLELALDQVGKQLLDVLVLGVGHVRTIVPHTSIALFAVDVPTVVVVSLVDEAVVGPEIVADRQSADSTAEHRDLFHRVPVK